MQGLKISCVMRGSEDAAVAVLQQAVTVKCAGPLVIQAVLFCFQPAKQASILLINLKMHV